MSCWHFWTVKSWSLAGVWMIVALGFTGCSGPYTGEVSGTVTYQEKPLPGGMVTIVHPDGRIGEGKIQEDGSYSIPNAPGGDVKVKVFTQPPLGDSKMLFGKVKGAVKDGGAIYPLGPYKKIPAKYDDPDKSGLTLTVKRGSQTYDIVLKD